MNKEKNLFFSHREITDEEEYNNIKKLSKSSDVITKPEEWKKQRLLQLKKEGKSWSK